MSISVDGGGLCLTSHKQFGNYTFSANLLTALNMYDIGNDYTVYTFGKNRYDKPVNSHILFRKLPQKAWMKLHISLSEFIRPKDVFLALNQAIPIYTKAKIITFSHGNSFLLHKQLYKDDYDRLKAQYDEYIKRSDYIIVSSQRVKDEILAREHHAKLEKKIVTLPFGVPFEFLTFEKQKRQPFFLFSGMNHPIKNIDFILQAFYHFRQGKNYNHFKLYLVGPYLHYASDDVKVFPHLSATELKELYVTSTAYLTASHYESFNFPVLEALSQECPVIGTMSAIIPEMQPYCQIAHNQEEYINILRSAAAEKCTVVSKEDIVEQFSWDTYVKSLVELYN